MDRIKGATPKEQSHLELVRDLRSEIRGSIDEQYKQACIEFGLPYDEDLDKVKAVRIGRISIEDNYPAVVVYAIAQDPVGEGEGYSSWDYHTGLDCYLQAKRGIESTVDEKIIQFQVAIERLLLGMYPGRGKFTRVQFADVVAEEAVLLTAFTATFTVRVGKTYIGIPV